MTNKLLINSTQIPNVFFDWLPELSGSEVKIVLVVARQTYGWHKDQDRISYSQLIQRTGCANGTIGSSLKSLREKGVIKVVDEKGKQLFTKEDCFGKDIFYKLGVTSPKIGDPLSKNWNPKIGDTKETITKTFNNKLLKARNKISCPLISNSVLKEKWPKGHTECVEYVTSFKFVNKAKQFRMLHRMLSAGLDFADIDRLIDQIEKNKFYKANGWDLATVFAEADRRSNATA